MDDITYATASKLGLVVGGVEGMVIVNLKGKQGWQPCRRK
jgi:hypothetical protein